MMRIVEIQDHHLVKTHMTPRRHLPEASAPRKHVEASTLPGPVKVPLIGKAGPWTHKAHLTSDYVPQLRQLVEGQCAKPRADARYPGILGQLIDLGSVLRYGRRCPIADVIA